MSLYLIVLCGVQKRKHNDKKHNELDETGMKSYTASMHKIVAEYPKNRSMQTNILGVVVAFVILVMALAQLFGFEDLPGILRNFWGIGDDAGLLLAALLVTVEIFALPALLAMKLSPLMRWCSGVAGVIAAGYWVVASFHLIALSTTSDSGMFGGKLETMSGLLLPAISALLVALLWAYWVSAFGGKLLGGKKTSSKG